MIGHRQKSGWLEQWLVRWRMAWLACWRVAWLVRWRVAWLACWGEVPGWWWRGVALVIPTCELGLAGGA